MAETRQRTMSHGEALRVMDDRIQELEQAVVFLLSRVVFPDKEKAEELADEIRKFRERAYR